MNEVAGSTIVLLLIEMRPIAIVVIGGLCFAILKTITFVLF